MCISKGACYFAIQFLNRFKQNLKKFGGTIKEDLFVSRPPPNGVDRLSLLIYHN